MSRALLALVAALIALAGVAQAHVTELAVLRLGALGDGRYTVTWELRPNTEAGRGLEPIFPEQCRFEEPLLECGAKGLAGRLGFEGIGEGQSAAMFKLRDEQGRTQVFTLTPAAPFAEVSPSFDASSWEGLARVAVAYLQIGIEHILLGIDHLLFVLGLIWVARGRWMLVKTITAFTLAHSVTLGAVTFGWFGVPEVFVNAMIALSIVFIAVEVLHAREGRSTVTMRNPWAVSFFFGLLHGLGFANALTALGLPEDALPVALVAFNVGVELGQLAFVFGVLAMGWAWRTMRVRFPERVRLVPAYTIGALAAFWFFERTAVLFGGT